MSTDLFVAIVRYTMLAGAIYDVAFAIPILLAPEWLSRIIALPMPEQEIYLRFLGIFLLGLTLFYLMPVLHPGRYFGNVAAAAATRALGGLFMAVAVLRYGQPRPFLILAAGDLGWAAIHYLSLVPFAGWKVWQVAGLDVSARRRTAGRSAAPEIS